METGTLKELNVKEGDVVEFFCGADGWADYTRKYKGTKHTVDSDGGTKRKLNGDGGFSSGSTHTFKIVSRVVTETDLTQNTTALGLMSEADQARMRSLPLDDVLVYDLDFRGKYSFVLAPMEHLVSTGIYRQRPEPIRVSIADLTGTVALDADGKPDFSTYEDEQ